MFDVDAKAGVPQAPTAEELAMGLVGLEVSASDAPAPPAAKPSAGAPASAIRWIGDKARSAAYPLLYPFELHGVEYRDVTVRRLTAGEVEAFVERMRADPDSSRRIPMYFIGEVNVSDAAWTALDDDDRLALEEKATAFLPARFRLPTRDGDS